MHKMAVAGLPKEEVSFQTTVRQPAQISQNLVADHIINAGGGTARIAHLTDDGREIN